MRRGDGVGKGHLKVGPLFLDLIGRHSHVAQVVQGVKNPDDVDAVPHSALHEFPHHVVSIVPVPHQVLPPQEHLELGILEALSQEPQPFPGVFVQEAHTRVEGRPSPDFQGGVPHLIHDLRHREHVFGAKPGGHDGLVRIPQGGLHDPHSAPLQGALGGTVVFFGLLKPPRNDGLCGSSSVFSPTLPLAFLLHDHSSSCFFKNHRYD